jgi:hypothetical protein
VTSSAALPGSRSVARAADRHGWLHVRRLIAQHGADAAMPDMLRALTGGCPMREAFIVHERRAPLVPGRSGGPSEMHPVDTRDAQRDEPVAWPFE